MMSAKCSLIVITAPHPPCSAYSVTDNWRQLHKSLLPIVGKKASAPAASCAACILGHDLVRNDSLRLVLKLGKRHFVLR